MLLGLNEKVDIFSAYSHPPTNLDCLLNKIKLDKTTNCMLKANGRSFFAFLGQKSVAVRIQLCITINKPSDNSVEFLEISLDSKVSSNSLKRQKIPQCKEFSCEARALPAQLSLTIPIKNLTRH